MTASPHRVSEGEGLPILIAGGEGRRLRPITTVLPKPLIPVKGEPIILHILRQLDAQGFDRAVVVTGYLGHLIKAVVQQTAFSSLVVDFLEESVPLGTAGILRRVNDEFAPSYGIAINADTLSDIRYDRLEPPVGVDGVMVVTRIVEQSKHGHVETGPNMEIVGLREKPATEHLVSVGVNAFSGNVMALIDEGERIDVPSLVERALHLGFNITAKEHQGEWTDLGTFDDLEGILSRFSDE